MPESKDFATPAQGRYGGGPGQGITLPPYYRPTPGVRNGTTFFPGSEELGEDEMRVTFAGTCPFPPRRSQAGTCILVELGNGHSFVFDFGVGALRNLVALGVPVPCVNDVFFTDLHAATIGDLPYLYCFAPWTGRWTPLRVHGPSGRRREDGTAAMVAGMQKMTHWHTKAFSAVPVGDGYDVEVNEFDWEDDGGICYEKDGVTIQHWGRVSNMSGSTGYRLDWNGLSFAWTGDGRADQPTIDVCKGVDVFVTALQLDTGPVASTLTGIPEVLYDLSTDVAHTSHYGAGYLINAVEPRLGMVTGMAYDHMLVNETIAGVRAHWDGLFALGAPDGVVVNVTRDAVWNREASLPESGNSRRATSPAELAAMFGGNIPETLEVPQPPYHFADLMDEETLSHEISASAYAPANVERPLVREFPAHLVGKRIPIAMLVGAGEVSEAVQQLTRASKALVEGYGQLTAGALERVTPIEAVGAPMVRGVRAATRLGSRVLLGAERTQRRISQLVQSRARASQDQGPDASQANAPGSSDDHQAASLAFGHRGGAPGTGDTSSSARSLTSPPAAAGRYETPPGRGITLPEYYRPTPSVRNATTYFPQSEELGPDEMRVTFMGTCPFPPKRDQAATCILVELGNGRSFVFDFGPGCLRNLVAAQVPLSTINDIFITHLHADHYGELPYLYGTAPWMGRYTPLRVHGPSGRTPAEGTGALIDAMQEMTRWNTTAYSSVPTGRGFEVDVNEFDWEDDGGICYQRDDVTIRHWRRIHNMCGATGYRLDWNGLSFVWTGDGRPDELTIEQCQGVDLFVTELQLDTGALVSIKTGVPEVIYNMTIDMVHTDHYATGYMINAVNPRMGMVTHMGYDQATVNEALAGVQTHWDGLFGFGAPDGVVVNVTKDAIWTRQSAWPDAANPRPATTETELAAAYGSEPRTVPAPSRTVSDLVSKRRLAKAVPASRYVPPSVARAPVHEFPRQRAAEEAAKTTTRAPGPRGRRRATKS